MNLILKYFRNLFLSFNEAWSMLKPQFLHLTDCKPQLLAVMQLGPDRSEARMFFSFVTYGIFRIVLLQAIITEKKTVKICLKIAISPSYVERKN